MSRLAQALDPHAFDGSTYSASRDGARLKGQQERVTAVMLDGRARTLEEIAWQAKVPMSTISSRVRDMRKPRFGGHDVQKEHVGNGLWRYYVVKKQERAEQ